MENEELTYLMALCALHVNSVRRIHLLLDHYGSAREAWKHEGEGANAALQKAYKELDFIHQHQIAIFDYTHSDYPDRLRQCPDAPLILYGKGNIHPNQGKFISIVGTRAASERGKEFTRQLVLDLAQKVSNVTIVSGLAFGVDVAAHRAALEAGISTIIVPAHGLDRIYPPLHRQVAVDALENGGILTEYMSGTEPERFNFVARNRIIAGMADAVVVVESRAKGGSLITAQMACDYDRSLFAVPGRPNDLNSRGCNELIRNQKAALIESADDLVLQMQWEEESVPVQTKMADLLVDLNEDEKRLLQILRTAEDGVHINSLVMEAGLDYASTASSLMMMEMNGLVKSLPGGMYRSVG